MWLKRIEALLEARIGLHLESLGTGALKDAVQRRMTALGLSDPTMYAGRAEALEVELKALVEEMVVSETWFFREAASFDLLRTLALADGMARKRAFRVLSIPCATGEEPYSLAMILLKAGLEPGCFEVHGRDVSEKALQAAKRGVYSKNSFRAPMDAYMKHFASGEAGLQHLARDVRELVQLGEGNVLDPQLFPAGEFDAIFCRNLLIYLSREARASALKNLLRMLRPEGVLFVGHSEAFDVSEAGLTRVGEARCFAFAAPLAPAKTTRVASQPRHSSTPELRARRPPPVGKLRPSARSAPKVSRAVVQSKPGTSAEDSLERARTLADQGKLEAAVTCCEQAIAQTPTNAEAHCLMGVLKRAAHDLAGSRGCFQKALYLNASHYEALIHLALLSEHEGDIDDARKLRERAARVRKRAQS